MWFGVEGYRVGVGTGGDCAEGHHVYLRDATASSTRAYGTRPHLQNDSMGRDSVSDTQCGTRQCDQRVVWDEIDCAEGHHVYLFTIIIIITFLLITLTCHAES